LSDDGRCGSKKGKKGKSFVSSASGWLKAAYIRNLSNRFRLKEVDRIDMDFKAKTEAKK
jgi:hypothetical protein